jgi:LysR family cyn operon transcriptional activator
MNLRFLRSFVEIAEDAGFARAAMRLNLTHSAASRQIQALGDELGLRLFMGAGRGVRLTSEGEDLLIRSRRLLFDADAIRQRASARMAGSRTHAVSRTFGRTCCSKALRRRRSSHWPEPATV